MKIHSNCERITIKNSFLNRYSVNLTLFVLYVFLRPGLAYDLLGDPELHKIVQIYQNNNVSTPHSNQDREETVDDTPGRHVVNSTEQTTGRLYRNQNYGSAPVSELEITEVYEMETSIALSNLTNKSSPTGNSSEFGRKLDMKLHDAYNDREVERLTEIHRQMVLAFCKILPSIVCPLGLTANILSIVVLTRSWMKCSTNVYLTAVATYDMLYITCYYIFMLSKLEEMQTLRWFFSILPFVFATCNALSNTTTWLTVSFTLERFLVVSYPLWGHRNCTYSRAKKVVYGVCILCFFLSFPDYLSVVYDVIPSQAGLTNQTASYPNSTSSGFSAPQISTQNTNTSLISTDGYERSNASLGWMNTSISDGLGVQAATKPTRYRLKYSGMKAFFDIFFYTYLNQFLFFLLPWFILLVLNTLLIRSLCKADRRRAAMVQQSVSIRYNSHHHHHTAPVGTRRCNGAGGSYLSVVNKMVTNSRFSNKTENALTREKSLSLNSPNTVSNTINISHDSNNNNGEDNDNNDINTSEINACRKTWSVSTKSEMSAIIPNLPGALLREPNSETASQKQERPTSVGNYRLKRSNLRSDSAYNNNSRRSTFSEQHRTTLMLISIVLAFLILQMPSVITLLVPPSNWRNNQIQQIVAIVTNFLLLLNATMNFVFYSLFSVKFRRTCFDLLRRAACRPLKRNSMTAGISVIVTTGGEQLLLNAVTDTNCDFESTSVSSNQPRKMPPNCWHGRMFPRIFCCCKDWNLVTGSLSASQMCGKLCRSSGEHSAAVTEKAEIVGVEKLSKYHMHHQKKRKKMMKRIKKKKMILPTRHAKQLAIGHTQNSEGLTVKNGNTKSDEEKREDNEKLNLDKQHSIPPSSRHGRAFVNEPINSPFFTNKENYFASVREVELYSKNSTDPSYSLGAHKNTDDRAACFTSKDENQKNSSETADRRGHELSSIECVLES